MPNGSADEHIKKGLIFLRKANKHVIRASHPLEKLVGNAHPPGIPDLLTDYDFEVAGHSYCGLLTKRQAAYLNGYTDSLKKFAKAVMILLMISNKNVVQALADWRGPRSSADSSQGSQATGRVPVPTGCCTVDGDKYNNCTKTYCEQGLLGNWSSEPCGTRPLSKSSKAAGAK